MTPAKLLSATTLIYQDQDGDAVTVKFTKPLLTEANVSNVFDFDVGDVDGNLPKQQLRVIDLTSLNAGGTSVSVVATRSAANGGDGFANVGRVNATGIDLGAISIDGDLGQIDCGDADATTVGLASLTVQSMGRFGTSTQNPFGDLVSDIQGQLTTLIVKADVIGATVSALGEGGKIGTITIGGSLIGGPEGEFEGAIGSSLSIGAITIKGDMLGGAGQSSGFIGTGKLGGITIGGSLISGNGTFSGRIDADDIGPIRIGGSVRGNGGGIDADNGITSFSAAGSLIDASVSAGPGGIGPTKVGGDIAGGGITTDGPIVSVRIGGSVRSGALEGFISAGQDVGPIKVGGSLIGTSAQPVIILGRGQQTPSPSADVAIKSLTVGGRVEFALIQAGYDFDGTPLNADAQIGPVVVGGDWIASSIAAGVDAVDVFFGNADDIKAVGAEVVDSPARTSRIASLLIKGQALGTANGADSFGITAEAIGSLSIGGVSFSLTSAKDELAIGATGDFFVREL